VRIQGGGLQEDEQEDEDENITDIEDATLDNILEDDDDAWEAITAETMMILLSRHASNAWWFLFSILGRVARRMSMTGSRCLNGKRAWGMKLFPSGINIGKRIIVENEK
jgi:hypothetical protein